MTKKAATKIASGLIEAIRISRGTVKGRTLEEVVTPLPADRQERVRRGASRRIDEERGSSSSGRLPHGGKLKP